MLDLPDDKTLPPITDRGLQGQLMDVAWPLYGGDMQTAEFWCDFGEGVRFAVHFLTPVVPPKTEADYDDALNDAGWRLLELLQAEGPVVPRQFNAIKPILRTVIEGYLKAKPEAASVAGLQHALEMAWASNREREAEIAKLRETFRAFVRSIENAPIPLSLIGSVGPAFSAVRELLGDE